MTLRTVLISQVILLAGLEILSAEFPRHFLFTYYQPWEKSYQSELEDLQPSYQRHDLHGLLMNSTNNERDLTLEKTKIKGIIISNIRQQIEDILKRDMLSGKLSSYKVGRRADGLKAVGILFANQMKFLGFLKSGHIQIPKEARNELNSMVSNSDSSESKQLLKKINTEASNHLIRRIRTMKLSKGHADFTRFGMLIQLRRELLCPIIQHTYTEELDATKHALLLLMKVSPFLFSVQTTNVKKFKKIDLPPSDWIPLSLVGKIPIEPQGSNAFDIETSKLLEHWKGALNAPEPHLFKRPRYHDLPVQISEIPYETRYMDFTCEQSALYLQTAMENVQTSDHCLTMPVRIERLLDPEKVALQCQSVYPKDAILIYAKTTNSRSQGIQRLYFKRECTQNGWGEPEEVPTQMGEKMIKQCRRRQLLADFT